MSDPVTNVQIEDVLSSIRRLVAEGDRAKQEKKREYGDDQLNAGSERLVLTPSLRISDDEKPISGTEPEAPAAKAADGAFVLSPDEHAVEEQTASLKDVFVGEPHAVAEAPDLSVLLSAASATTAPADETVITEQDQIEFSEASAEAEVVAPENQEVSLHEAEDEHMSIEATAEETSRASLEATIAALEAAVTSDTDEFEPDGSEVAFSTSWGSASGRDDTADTALTEVTTTEAEIFEEVEQGEPLGTIDEDRLAASIEAEPEAQQEQSDANLEDTGVLVLRPAQFPANDAAPEPAVADQASDVQHDRNEQGNGAVDAPHAEATEDTGRVFRVVPDHPPEEAKAIESSDALAGMEATAQTFADDEDHEDELIGGSEDQLVSQDEDLSSALAADDLLDEDAIKRIVAEVLKGELEGHLGETITRNVRRLVRREINRVISHQELH